MKILITAFLICGFSGAGMAQACGYTFLTVYVTDSNERKVADAIIKTFESDFKKEDRLHYRRDDDFPDRLNKRIAWSDIKQAYFGGEGLCGGHRNVGLRIDAIGFERFETIINLPLGWTSYAIRLRQSGSSVTATATKLSHIVGHLEDVDATRVPSAEITLVRKNASRILTSSNDRGQFEFDVPVGDYEIAISKDGFNKLRIVNLNILESEGEFLDLKLDRDDGVDKILDYQTIKRKKNN